MSNRSTRRPVIVPVQHSAVTRRSLMKAGGGLALAGGLTSGFGLSRVAVAGHLQQQVWITVTDAPGEEAPEQIREHYEQLVERFKEVRPDVAIESHPRGFGGQDVFAAKVTGGTLETGFGVWFTEPQRLIAQGIVADISEPLKAWPQFASYNPDVLQVVTGPNDQLFGIPVNVYALSLAYNRQLFEQAGLDPDAPPTTWDETRTAAKQIADNTDTAGFAFLSTNNQGGWHFTTLMYTLGGSPVEDQNGQWVATFNNEIGVQVGELLKTMRWVDRSMTEEQLLTQETVTELLATGQVAMAISGIPGSLAQYGADINDFGLGVVPQGGGNAVLGGGYAWMFNADASPEQLQAAVDWVLFRYFDLDNNRSSMEASIAAGNPVGFPSPPLFTGELQQRQALEAELATVPTELYAPYVEGMRSIEVRPEPSAIDVQKLYAAIDPVVQAILTEEDADPKRLLDEAAQQYQSSVLDAAT